MASVKYPLRFRAAILEEQNAALHVDEVEFTGPLLPGQVLVKVFYSGICGKQVEEVKGTAGPDRFIPHMLGHEGVGKVIDAGPGVSKVKGGETVVLHWLKGSGIESATPLYYRKGQRINAGWITTFNEYAVVSENRLTVIPEQADQLSACILGCAGMTGLGVIIYEANLRPGQSVAIFGCGGVGLCALLGAQLVTASPIIAVDICTASLDRAREFGADIIVNSSDGNAEELIRNATAGCGVEKCVVTVGAPQAIEFAARVTAHPGELFLVAVPPVNSSIHLDALAIHRRRSLMGSYGGGASPDRDIPRMLELISRKKLDLRKLVGPVLKLDQINEGLQQTISGSGARVLLDLR